MLIPIPTGMNYRARAWGSAIKEVTCAHCGAVFVYEMRRMVSTQASAPLFIGMGGAEARAGENARALLAHELAQENDDVPCPACKKLQPSMNQTKRKGWRVVIVVAWVFLLIVAFFGHEVAESQFRPDSAWVKWLPIAATILAVAAIIGLRFLQFRGTATDRAQLRSEAEAEHFARLGLPRVVSDRWIWVRATLFQGPSICAGCGAPDAPKTCRRHLNGIPMDARLCLRCHRAAMVKRILAGAAAFGLPLAGCMLIAMSLKDWDGLDLCFGFMGGTIAGVLGLAVTLNWFIRRAGFPIQFRKFRPRRDEVELKFKSQAAAEEFVAGMIQRMQDRMSAQAATGA